MKTIKHFLILFTLSTSPLISNAQFDTTSAIYDFESLPNGNLGGQDNWVTTKFNTTVDLRVADTLPGNVGKGVFFNQSGPNVGASGSRLFDSIFPGSVFDRSLSTYIYEFDIVRNYWGVDVGIAADLDNDGKTSRSDAAEKALVFRSGSLNGEILTVPNGTAYNLGNNLTAAWYTIRLTIRPFSGSFGGTVDVEYQPVFSGTWTTIGSGLPLYADTLSNTKTNITRWNNIFIHCETANGKIDELRFTKISPQQTTGINELKNIDFKVYYSSGQLFIETGSNNLPRAIEVIDTSGKLILSRTCGDCSSIPFEHVRSGNYIVRALDPDNKASIRNVLVE